MAVSYRERLDKIRLACPQPVSDRVHDSCFVHSIVRALDLVDSLKSEVPVLGPPPLKSIYLVAFHTDEPNVEAVVEKV